MSLQIFCPVFGEKCHVDAKQIRWIYIKLKKTHSPFTTQFRDITVNLGRSIGTLHFIKQNIQSKFFFCQRSSSSTANWFHDLYPFLPFSSILYQHLSQCHAIRIRCPGLMYSAGLLVQVDDGAEATTEVRFSKVGWFPSGTLAVLSGKSHFLIGKFMYIMIFQ